MASIVSSGSTVAGTANDDTIVVIETGAPNGPDKISGGDGNDSIIGDHAPVFVDTIADNSTFFNALNIDAIDHWSVQENQDVVGGPFTTVVGTGAGAIDVYAVTVGAGQTITIDTDYTSFDTIVQILDAFGNPVSGLKDSAGGAITIADDSPVTAGGLGSEHSDNPGHDSYATFVAPTAGTYYIQVGQYNSGTVGAIPQDETYQLNLSVTGHAAAGTVTDAVAGNSSIATATNIDSSLLWSLQGSTDLFDGGQSPHATIQGTGAGEVDMFAVTIGAGKTITLDADYTQFDTVVRLLDANGNEVALNDDNFVYLGGLGSSTDHDSFLQFTAQTTGTYYIQIGQYQNGLPGAIPQGDTYQLNVSIDGHNATAARDADTITGDGGNDTLQGVDGDDTLYGGVGDDTLYGGAGNDKLNGGAGNDSTYGGAGDDTFVLDQATGDDIIRGGGGSDTIDLSKQTAGWDVNLNYDIAHSSGPVTATANIIDGDFENIIGTSYNDTLNALFQGGGTLNGGAGNDLLIAHDGNDVMIGGTGVDTVSYEFSGSDVTVTLAVTTQQNTGGSFLDTLSLIENLTGSQNSDTLTGNSGANTIKGGLGYDIIEGLGGNDILDGEGNGEPDGPVSNEVTYIHATSAVTVDLAKVGIAQNTVGAGVDTLSNFSDLEGSAYADTLYGDDGQNAIYGGAGNDTIEGRDGDDSLYGGTGKDTASYSTAGSGVAVTLLLQGMNQDTVGAGSDYLDGFENLTGSAFADTLTGDDFANVLTGLGGNDVLSGGLGNDILDGGTGNDTADYYGGNGVTVNLSVAGSQNTVGAGTDALVAIENVTGSFFADTLTGNDGVNKILGMEGNDIISGGLGNDILDGGGGVDGGVNTVTYASATSAVKVSLAITIAQGTLGAGNDTLANFQNLIGTAFDDQLTGDMYNNILTGGSGNDLLVGGLGDDTLNGGVGTDTASYAAAAAAVTVNLAIAAAQNTVGDGVDTLAGIENLIGSAYADTLSGSTLDNVIDGGAGNDTIVAGSGNDTVIGGLGNDLLDGGSGNDSLDGGTGIDTVTYATASAAVTVSLAIAAAQATGGSGSDTLAGIENLIGSNYNDVLTGNTGANSLYGGTGNDTLTGGAGNDLLDGGAGSDLANYAGTATAVTVNLSIAAAQNTGGAGVDTLAGIENVTGSSFNDVLTGDGNANTLTGGDGNDLLSGGLGNDSLFGGNGIDTASYASAASAVKVSLALVAAQNTLGAGTDTLGGVENLTGSTYDDQLTGDGNNNQLDGGAGNDTLTGGAGSDTLIGGAGLDTLVGGLGGDTLTGGLGADLFKYASVTESGPGTVGADRITDFANGDTLNVSAIDADTTVAGDQAFHLAAAFTHAAGEYTMAFNGGTNTTTMSFDTDGDATADMTILFTGNVTALAANFVL